MENKFRRINKSNKFIISSSMVAIIIQVCSILTLISFVSITLAQEDGRSVPTQRYRTTNNASEEERLRAAGISFPTWEEIRESFKKFQAQLNTLRRNGSLSMGSNDYRNSNGGNYGSGIYTGNDHDVSTNRYHPGLISGRPANPYYTTFSEPSAASDLQKHTTTTIYIISICLIIMVLGSILFICISKFQERSALENSTNRTNSRSNNNVISSSNRNSRISDSTISFGLDTDGIPSSSTSAAGSTLSIPGANVEYNAKITYDLPPSYDSLFPDGKPPS